MKKVFMIGNTHFDPVWLWKWDEAMSSITATFRSALERMEEFPEFIYSFATPPVFEWIKKTDPELFQQIKLKVTEGRWDLAEGWWLQPDCYCALGESYARQGLYGQRYLMENFGKYTKVVFNIDSFGHPSTFPQILSKSGIDYYVFCRPESRHIPLKEPFFNWESSDGSQVLTFRDEAPYLGDINEKITNALSLDYDSILVYGVSDHGGAPTIEALNAIRNYDNAVCSSVEEFFLNRTTDYTYKGELITGDFGVYANNPRIKTLNRTAEYALLNAEKAGVISGNNESEELKKCWQDVMFNQFHDILGGACIKDAYFDAENLYGRAISTAKELMHYNLLKVTNKINMPGKNPENAWNIVVWNLNPHKFKGFIEAEVQWIHQFPWYDKGIALEDAEGNRYNCQIIREKSVIPAFRSRFLFKAEIDGMGYKAFKVIQTSEEVENILTPYTDTINTEKYVINFAEGKINSVINRKTGENICNGLLYPVAFEDDGDTWCFNVDSYGKCCEMPDLVKTEVTESGEFRTVIKATYNFRSSKIEMYYNIYNDTDYVDVNYRVNWNEKHICLKLLTDTNIQSHTVSIPYGTANRGKTLADVPMGEWISTDKLSFAVKGIFAYNYLDNALGLTVLRSPIYGDLRISEIDLETDYDIISQGITEGSVRVFFADVNIAKEAVLFNNPPVVLCESNHKGELSAKGSFCEFKSENALLCTVKYAENSNGVIIRGVNYSDSPETATLVFENQEYPLELAPSEIFTYKISNGKALKVNILEE